MTAPITPTEPYGDRRDARWRGIQWSRLLDTIERLGLVEDTIVVFTSDNGADNSTLAREPLIPPAASVDFIPTATPAGPPSPDYIERINGPD